MTLTYGPNYPMDGKVAKRHLNKFLVYARREFGPFEYFWVLEFQKRGAVHFHLATTLPEPNIFERERFADIWANISQEGNWAYHTLELLSNGPKPVLLQNTREAVYKVHVNPKAWEVVRSEDGMGRYLAKYANKLRQKEVPVWYRNVGRFWGVSRGVKLPLPREETGDDESVRYVAWLKGRDTAKWKVLPKIILA